MLTGIRGTWCDRALVIGPGAGSKDVQEGMQHVEGRPGVGSAGLTAVVSTTHRAGRWASLVSHQLLQGSVTSPQCLVGRRGQGRVLPPLLATAHGDSVSQPPAP